VEAGKKDIQYWTVGLKGVDLKHRGGWGFGQSGDYWVDLNLLDTGSIEQVMSGSPCFIRKSWGLKVDVSPVIEGDVIRERCTSAFRSSWKWCERSSQKVKRFAKATKHELTHWSARALGACYNVFSMIQLARFNHTKSCGIVLTDFARWEVETLQGCRQNLLPMQSSSKLPLPGTRFLEW
jgi:hypothetical protein